MSHPAARLAASKSIADIAYEWDLLAETRKQQLRNGVDLSYGRVVVPTLLSLVDGVPASRVLDIGCGVGELTNQLGDMYGRVVGVDPSASSIDVARGDASAAGLEFFPKSLEEFASAQREELFELLVANMSLMDAPDLPGILTATATLSAPNAVFVFSITHPWFWPVYWRYSDAPWFTYERELAIEAEFNISLAETSLVSTHFHRPLQTYVEALHDAGFAIDRLMEPMPTREVEASYPMPWRYPRFLVARCRFNRPRD